MVIRKFHYMKSGKRVDLIDIDPTLSADEVRKAHAAKHPDLLNATVSEKGGGEVEFVLKVGRKG